MRIEILMSKLFGYSPQTYFNWKKESDKRPIINLLDKYFKKEELEEFLETGKIDKFENIENLDHFILYAGSILIKLETMSGGDLIIKKIKESPEISLVNLVSFIYTTDELDQNINDEQKLVLTNYFMQMHPYIFQFFCNNIHQSEKKLLDMRNVSIVPIIEKTLEANGLTLNFLKKTEQELKANQTKAIK